MGKKITEEKAKSRSLDEVMAEMDAYEKKRYSGLFGKFLNWWDPFWFNLRHTQPYKEVKWFIQRGKRGYSDRDCWNLGSYLSEVISKSVYQLSKNSIGYPEEFKYQKKWTATLCKISVAFDILNKMSNGDWILLDENTIISEEYKKHFHVMTKQDIKDMKEGMELFSKYITWLWD